MGKSALPVKKGKYLERKNKDIVQSHDFTIARYDFDVYEKRILYRTVELLQSDIFSKTAYSDIIQISMPVASVLPKGGEENTNYAAVKKALYRLLDKKMAFENKEKKIWEATTIIAFPKFKQGVLSFQLHQNVYNLLLLTSSQFHRFELETILSLRSVYSMRFYELFSGKLQPLTYDVMTLREMFQLTDKYKNTAHFIEKAVEVAKQELDLKSPVTFRYELVKFPESKKIKSIRFFPIYQAEKRDPELRKRDERKRLRLLDYLIPEEVEEVKKLGVERKLKQEVGLLESIAKARRRGKIFINKNLIYFTYNAGKPPQYFLSALRQEVARFEEQILKEHRRLEAESQQKAVHQEEIAYLKSLGMEGEALEKALRFIIPKGGVEYLFVIQRAVMAKEKELKNVSSLVLKQLQEKMQKENSFLETEVTVGTPPKRRKAKTQTKKDSITQRIEVVEEVRWLPARIQIEVPLVLVAKEKPVVSPSLTAKQNKVSVLKKEKIRRLFLQFLCLIDIFRFFE